MGNEVNAVATPEVAVAEVNVPVQEQVANETKTTDDVVRSLIIDGWSRLNNQVVKNVRITNVTASTGTEYTRLCFILQNSIIPRYMMDETTGEFSRLWQNRKS